MSRCKICIPENYTPNLDDFYDPARDVKSLNKRFKKHASRDFGMYFSFFSIMSFPIYLYCEYRVQLFVNIHLEYRLLSSTFSSNVLSKII